MATTATTQITGIDATFYLVKDVSRALAFWRDVMGLKNVVWEGEQGAEFELPDGSAFGLWRPEDGEWHTGGTVMFAVPDVREAAAAYRQRGAKIAEEIFEGPTCSMAFGEDSEGNAFILHHRKA